MKRLAILGITATLLTTLGACMPGQQGAGGGESGGGDILMSILPLILIFVVFYFLLIRPNQKKQKAHKEMLQQVGRGDEIVTSGGLVGKVVRSRDDQLLVEIATDVRVRLKRTGIADVTRRSEVDFDDEDDFEDDLEGDEEEYSEDSELESEEDKKSDK